MTTTARNRGYFMHTEPFPPRLPGAGPGSHRDLPERDDVRPERPSGDPPQSDSARRCAGPERENALGHQGAPSGWRPTGRWPNRSRHRRYRLSQNAALTRSTWLNTERCRDQDGGRPHTRQTATGSARPPTPLGRTRGRVTARARTLSPCVRLYYGLSPPPSPLPVDDGPTVAAHLTCDRASQGAGLTCRYGASEPSLRRRLRTGGHVRRGPCENSRSEE